ncbi:MAG: hypothetical protein IPM79_01660 [Polyangiaceae bacterium]|nr:hypothetical protein [Polyangiaceae bacterium]
MSTSTDATNCGACARDCTFEGAFPGTMCVSGQCDPVTLANKPYGAFCGAFSGPLLGAPVTTHEADPYVYFATASTIYHVPKTGGLADVSLEDCGGMSGLLHSGAHLVATRYLGQGGTGGQVFVTSALAPNPVWTILIDQHCGAVSGGGGSVTARGGVWVEGHGALRACGGTGAQNYSYVWLPNGAILEGSNQPLEMVWSPTGGDDRAWWLGTDANIWSWTAPANSAAIAYTDTGVSSLVGVGDALFWSSTDTSIGAGGQAIIRGAGLDVAVIASPADLEVAPQALAADPAHVCWLESSGVFCVPNGGLLQTPAWIGVADLPVQSLAVDSTSVYWTEADAATMTVYLRRAPL